MKQLLSLLTVFGIIFLASSCDARKTVFKNRISMSDLSVTGGNYKYRRSNPSGYMSARADFDGNGKIDTVQFYRSGNSYQLIVHLDKPIGQLKYVLMQGPYDDVERYGVEVAVSGIYATACSKGYGEDCGKKPKEVELFHPGVRFIIFESGERVFYWSDNGFASFNTSD